MPDIIRKQMGALTKMAGAQASDLDLINQYIQPGAEIAPEDVLVFSGKLAHDQYDRSHERFPVSYLERFAETLPGKSVLIGHDYTKSGVGRWFDAEVRKDGDGHGLYVKGYVRATSDTAHDIRLGIAKDLSIGFVPDKRFCDHCGKDYERECVHMAGQEYDGKLATVTYGGDEKKAEAVEGSLVWLGCQPGAQVLGQSSPLYQRKMALAQAAQEEDMELKEALLEIERLKPLAEAGERHQKAAEKYEAELRMEIATCTKVKEFAATHDEKAAQAAADFVSKMIKGADIDQLKEMRDDLREQVKTITAPRAEAGVGGRNVPAETNKRQPWEPRRRDW